MSKTSHLMEISRKFLTDRFDTAYTNEHSFHFYFQTFVAMKFNKLPKKAPYSSWDETCKTAKARTAKNGEFWQKNFKALMVRFHSHRSATSRICQSLKFLISSKSLQQKLFILDTDNSFQLVMFISNHLGNYSTQF